MVTVGTMMVRDHARTAPRRGRGNSHRVRVRLDAIRQCHSLDNSLPRGVESQLPAGRQGRLYTVGGRPPGLVHGLVRRGSCY